MEPCFANSLHIFFCFSPVYFLDLTYCQDSSNLSQKFASLIYLYFAEVIIQNMISIQNKNKEKKKKEKMEYLTG
jgi:hypothetical protein